MHSSTEPETVLVTGATGFIGQAVVEHLLANGNQVRAFARPTSAWPFDAHCRLKRFVGDMGDAESLARAAEGVDWVAHLAAAKADEPHSEQTNVGGARNLARAAQAAGVKTIVNVSTQSAKLTRKGTYGRTKETADQVLHASGVPVVTLRVSVVYGDLSSGVFGSLVRFSRLPIIPVLGPGTTKFQPIHRDDVAAAVAIAARKAALRGRHYDVGGPDQLSLNALIDAILAHEGRRRPKLHLPVWLGLALAHALAWLPRPPITVSNVLGSNESVAMDVASFFGDFGFTPRPFEQGLSELFSASEDDSALIRGEARSLLEYVFSRSGYQWHPESVVVQRYLDALRTHGLSARPCLNGLLLRCRWLMGSFDAATRVVEPDGVFQKKLLVAAAVMECHPVSAPWLLPTDRAVMGLLIEMFRLSFWIGVKWLGVPVALVVRMWAGRATRP